jgi:hypothetical protein
MLGRPAVRARLAALGVGKLVLYTVSDLRGREDDHLLCGAGYGGGGCIGFAQSRGGYAVGITVWDVYRREPITTDQIKVEHRFGVVGIGLPIPFWSSNETEACEQMQSYVRRALQPE